MESQEKQHQQSQKTFDQYLAELSGQKQPSPPRSRPPSADSQIYDSGKVSKRRSSMKGSKPKMRDRSMSVGFGAEDIKEIAKLELKKNSKME